MKGPIRWDLLPTEVLLEIFSFLSSEDSVKAASVCQRWSLAFQSPSIWRSVSCHFCGQSSLLMVSPSSNLSDPKSDPEKYETKYENGFAVKCAHNFGRHFRNLQIVCDPISTERCEETARIVWDFLSCLCKNATLVNLILRCPAYIVSDAWFISKWTSQYHRSLLEGLSKFLQTQTHLQVVDVSDLRAHNARDAVRIIENLGCTCGATLTQLKFHNLFDRNYRENDRSFWVPELERAMKNFHCLEFLALDDDMLTEEVLISVAGKSKLKLLEIALPLEDYRFHPDYTLDESVWKKALDLNPDFKVHVAIYRQYLNGLTERLYAAMPVVSLFFPCCLPWIYSSDLEDQLVSFFHHLSNSFCKTLETVTIDMKCASSRIKTFPIDSMLLELVKKCSKLKTLSVTANFSTETALTLCQMQNDKNVDLRNLHLQTVK